MGVLPTFFAITNHDCSFKGRFIEGDLKGDLKRFKGKFKGRFIEGDL